MQTQDGGRTDFVIIGCGVAGLFTAIRLAEHGRVTVLSKQDLIAGNTWFAQGGIAAAFSAEDSPGLHLEDTWQAGAGFGDRAAIGVLVEEAPDRIRDLLELGVLFDRRDGAIDLGQEGAHSRKRILHIGGDATGRELVEVLLNQARKKGVAFVEDAFARQLIVSEGRCSGVLFSQGGTDYTLYSDVVILAAGGCGQLFKCTTNSPAVTGDGLAMAYHAGAILRDLEFFQFHPTVYFPPTGNPFLISEAVRGEGARLVNAGGESFMESYHPRGELGPRDIVSRAILAEQARTGSEVFLDLRHLGDAFIRERFPTIFGRCLEWGLDITANLIPVSPAAHFLIGGVAVDLEGRTAVENLLAVGEIASTGVHGANRLASNSLLEGLVFGYRVAGAAASLKFGKSASPVAVRTDFKEADGKAEKVCAAARFLLQEVMWNNVGLIRSEEGMEAARDRLYEWRHLLHYRFKRVEFHETQNMLLIAMMMTGAALARRESKGCHFRSDYPDPAPENLPRYINFQNTGEDPEASFGLSPGDKNGSV